MRGESMRALVVGAGIAGLAAARTLRAWGAVVDVVERGPGPDTGGFGMYLPGNAVRALDALGVGAAVADRAVRVLRQRVGDHRGRVLFDLDMADLWGGVGPCLGVRRADLRAVLLDGVPVRWGTTPRTVSPDGPDGARVVFGDGREEHYDLVLGADGVHSTVRRLVFGHAARPVGQYARRFLVPWPDAEPVWSVRLGRGVTFLTVPTGRGELYCYCDVPADRSGAPAAEAFRDFAEPVRGLIAAASDPHGSPVEEVAGGPWSRGSVLLIGDAAHATSPNMAEGVAMAVEDALVLVESLDASPDVSTALAGYERRRRPRTDWVAAQTHRRDRLRGLAPWLRGLVLPRLGPRIFAANYRPLRRLP